jgi:hypothetical protein
MSRVIRAISAVLLGLLSLFLIFYTVRLLVVTRGLTAIRSGGRGAYIGAVVFPVLGLAFGWVAWRLLRSRR